MLCPECETGKPCEYRDRCPDCGLRVKISMVKGSHGCPNPYHEEE